MDFGEYSSESEGPAPDGVDNGSEKEADSNRDPDGSGPPEVESVSTVRYSEPNVVKLVSRPKSKISSLADVPEKIKLRFFVKNSRTISGQFVCGLCSVKTAKKSELESHFSLQHYEELVDFAGACDSAATNLSLNNNLTSRNRLRDLAAKDKLQGQNPGAAGVVTSTTLTSSNNQSESSATNATNQTLSFSLDAVLGSSTGSSDSLKRGKVQCWESEEQRQKRLRKAEDANIFRLKQHELQQTDAKTLERNDAAFGLNAPDLDVRIIEGLKGVFCGANLMNLPRGECRCILCREKFSTHQSAREHCLEVHVDDLNKKYLTKWQQYVHSIVNRESAFVEGAKNSQCPVCKGHFGKLKRHMGQQVWLTREGEHIKHFVSFKKDEEDSED